MGLPQLVASLAPNASLTELAHRDRSNILDRLTVHGALLFRGFDVQSVEDFQHFIDTLGLAKMDYTYRSTPRSSVSGNVMTATEYPKQQEIPLHSENSYQRNWPRRLAFYCHTPALSGGQTTIADMRQVTARIGARLTNEFEARKVRYVRHFREHVDLPWQSVFQTDSPEEVARFCAARDITHEWLDDGTLRTAQICQGAASHPHTGERFFFNQAHLFHRSSLGEAATQALEELFGTDRLPRDATFGDGAPISTDALCAIRTAFAHAAINVDWARGDVLLLDNMRMAHGRRRFEGDRRVYASLLDPAF